MEYPLCLDPLKPWGHTVNQRDLKLISEADNGDKGRVGLPLVWTTWKRWQWYRVLNHVLGEKAFYYDPNKL